jgi:LmbE family N-acetylglucosaminyl deacetylase
VTRLALALSPHLDDAAFSAGGTLARLADEGWEVVVATLFTASVPEPTGFALACQTDKGLAPDVDYMALRRAEDAAACAALGAQPVWLALPEAPHRGYHSAAALFGPPRPDDLAEREAAAALAPLLALLRPSLLLAPQAIGGHVDHVLLVRALRGMDIAVPVLWWQDFPYVCRATAPARPCEALLEGLPEAALPADAERKRRACAAYASQLGFQFGGTAGLARALEAAGSSEVFRLQGDAALVQAA